jgi:hypothetical protein
MNYIRHLTGFFHRVAQEDRLYPTHISLYMSLFQAWNINRFVNPISISRSEMMGVSKICSKATYHKVMKELHQLGFIKYEPSYNPFRGSAVHLINFEEEEVQKKNRRHTKKQTSDELAVNSYHTKNQDSTVLLNEPYINSINIVNSKLCKQQAHEDTSSDFNRVGKETEKNNYSAKRGNKKSKPGVRGAGLLLPTSVSEVHSFFEEEKSTKLEAERFFNYFQSNGWKVGGRAPMKDWQAAARNWILNSQKFEPNKKISSLHTTTNKNYGEPL